MATEALERGTGVRATGVRGPGMVDRLLRFVDSLPGPAAAWWAAVGVALTLIGHVVVWLSPQRQFGEFFHDVLTPSMMFAWFMWLTHTLNRVGAASFDDFRPALGAPELEDDYRRRLLSIDDRLAVLAGVVAIAVVSAGYYVFVRPIRAAMPLEIEVVAAPLWGLTSIAVGLVIMHTITQLRLVSHMSTIAKNIDIFKPGSLNAFSRLTAVSALGLIAFIVAFVLFSPAQPLAYVVQEAAILVVAVGSFVLPLRVMHDRLVAEKKRLLGDAQERLKQVLARVHAAVDADDLQPSEQLHHALAVVLAEIDVLNKLHTWPWSTATIRGFASALVLPIALILFTQFVDQVI